MRSLRGKAAYPTWRERAVNRHDAVFGERNLWDRMSRRDQGCNASIKKCAAALTRVWLRKGSKFIALMEIEAKTSHLAL